MALFKRKAKPEKVEEESAKRTPKFQGLSIGKIIWSGFLVIALISLLSGYSSYILYAESVERGDKEQQQATAQRVAEIFAARLDQLNQSVKMLLNEESFNSAEDQFSATETAPPPALQQRLTIQLPHLIRQVIVTAKTLPNANLSPPLIFACLELSSQQQSVMELHRFGT